MEGIVVILAILLALVPLGLFEAGLHRRRLARIPIRVHVNGTRGKSSVTRLIAAGLREGGIVTCAKTTGTLARMILPDGSEYPVFRPAGANVIEQVRIMATAASYHTRAIVIECMALQPHLQWLSESRFLRSTHGVVTNARPDHLDVMGPGERDVALALAATTTLKGTLYTAEEKFLPIFRYAAGDRGTRLVSVGLREVNGVEDAEMEKFPYIEHKENVALALRVCSDLGVDRSTALRGMWKARPDPGVMTISTVRFFGRHLFFVNAFAANDPESTEKLWNMAIARFPRVERRIAIFNCRADRPHRSRQLGQACASWQPADCYVLIGLGTYFFVRAAIEKGIALRKLVQAERQSEADLFETIVERGGGSTLVVGMGNTKGQGLRLARFFRNRSILRDRLKKEIP